MKNGINIYAILWAFTFSIALIIQVSGLSFKFKEINEISSLITECIEVNEGINKTVDDRVNQLYKDYPNYQINYNKYQINDMDYYVVDVNYLYQIPLINYQIPIKSSKQTRRIIP